MLVSSSVGWPNACICRSESMMGLQTRASGRLRHFLHYLNYHPQVYKTFTKLITIQPHFCVSSIDCVWHERSTMPHLHDESIATSESDVVQASSRDKPEDHQPTDDGNGPSASPSCETKVVDRLLSLATTATQHAPLRETEASNESPNIIGTTATGVGQHPAVTPSPFNALNRSQQDQEQPQQQERTGTNPSPSLFPPPPHYNGPMYSVYHGTKAIISSPIRGRSPPTKINHNDDDEQHLTTTIPKKPVLQASKNDKEVDADRCASPPRTRKVTTLEQFHRFVPSHHPHHPYHHGMVGVYGSMILPQSPIHHQRIHNGQAPGGATAVASSPFHWSAYQQHHPYHPYMTTTFPPSMMHADGNTASRKRSAPLEGREDEPSAKRRLSLPVQESARTVSGDSRAPSSSSLREPSSAPDELKKDEPKSDKTSEDESTEESLDSKRAESKDEKQRVISPSSSNDGGREEDDEFSNSANSSIPPRVEFGARGVSTSSKGGYPPPPPPMMPHPVHHARTMRGAHAMYSPFHHHLHHHQHHPAMLMGYPPASFAPAPQYEMHPAGWYAMGPPSGPPFPYAVMSRMGSTQPPTGTQPSSQQTSRAASPAFPAKTLFPHRGPPLSPVRSPNRDAEEVTPDAEDRKEAKKVDANAQPLPCVSQASSPEAPTSKTSTSSQPIKSVADWQKATIATGMAPSANRCVPLKAPIPTKYWG